MLNWQGKINWTLIIALFGGIFGGIPGIYQVYSKISDKPLLKGETHHLVVGEIGPAPKEIRGKKFPTSLPIYFYLTNHKEKPVTLLNQYKLFIKTDKVKVEAKPYYWEPNAIFQFVGNKQPKGFDFKRDYLFSKTDLEPIAQGGIIKG